VYGTGPTCLLSLYIFSFLSQNYLPLSCSSGVLLRHVLAVDVFLTVYPILARATRLSHLAPRSIPRRAPFIAMSCSIPCARRGVVGVLPTPSFPTRSSLLPQRVTSARRFSDENARCKHMFSVSYVLGICYNCFIWMLQK
jgi:hypothetical protein